MCTLRYRTLHRSRIIFFRGVTVKDDPWSLVKVSLALYDARDLDADLDDDVDGIQGYYATSTSPSTLRPPCRNVRRNIGIA